MNAKHKIFALVTSAMLLFTMPLPADIPVNKTISASVREALPQFDLLHIRVQSMNSESVVAEVDLIEPSSWRVCCVSVTLEKDLPSSPFKLTAESRVALDKAALAPPPEKRKFGETSSAQPNGPAPTTEPAPQSDPVANTHGEKTSPAANIDASLLVKELFAATENDNLQGVLAALAKGVDPNQKRTQTSLRARNPNKERVVDADDTPLSIAVKHCNPEIAKALLDAGADPNKEIWHKEKSLLLTRTVIFYATENDDAEMIRLLARYGADVNFEQTAVYQGSSYNESMSGTQTPLGVAVFGKFKASAKALLAAGANPNDEFWSFVRSGYTRHNGPLSILALACGEKNLSMLKLLVEAGADMNKAWTAPIGSWGTHGFTPLGAVVEAGDIELVEYMLKLGANPNLTAGSGTDYRGREVEIPTRTAIFYAKTPEMADRLINAGADVNYVFPGGGSRTGTVLDFTKDPVMREYLESKGAHSAYAGTTSYH